MVFSKKAENVDNNTNSSVINTKIVAPLKHRNSLERNNLETASLLLFMLSSRLD